MSCSPRPSVALRFVTGCVLVAIAVALPACGSDNGEDANAAKGSAGKQAATPPAGDEAEIRKLYADSIDSVYSTDYRAACNSMTPKHRQEVVGDQNCVKAMRELFQNRKPPAPAADIVKLTVRGDRATATTEAPGDTHPNTVIFVKRDGDWKIHASIRGIVDSDSR